MKPRGDHCTLVSKAPFVKDKLLSTCSLILTLSNHHPYRQTGEEGGVDQWCRSRLGSQGWANGKADPLASTQNLPRRAKRRCSPNDKSWAWTALKNWRMRWGALFSSRRDPSCIITTSRDWASIWEVGRIPKHESNELTWGSYCDFAKGVIFRGVILCSNC